MQSGPTAHQHLQLWAGSQQVREQRSGWGNLLKVIQQQQEVLVTQEAFKLIYHGLPGGFSQTQGMGDGGSDQCGIAQRLQRDEADTSGEVLSQISRYLERHPRFANTAGTREDQEAYLCQLEQRTDGCHLLLAGQSVV
jgi:hypothetical protein